MRAALAARPCAPSARMRRARPGLLRRMRAHFQRASAAECRGRDSGCGPRRRWPARRREQPREWIPREASSAHGSTLPCSAMREPNCARSFARSARQSTLRTLAPVGGHGLDQVIRRLRVQDYGRVPGVEFGKQKLRGGQLERAIVGKAEFAGPRVEELHGRRARGDLRAKIRRRGARDAFEQTRGAEQAPARASLSRWGNRRAAAFDQIAGERPRRGRETDYRVRPGQARARGGESRRR